MTVRARANLGSTKSYLTLLMNIKKGLEKEAAKVGKPGDILYCPQEDSLYLMITETKLQRPARLLGHLESGLDQLNEVPNGTNVKIELSSG
jgi:hypothetical protein